MEHWVQETVVYGFDLETTSKNRRRALPVSAALTRHNGPGWEAVEGFPFLINPGEPIPAETVEIHGITDERVAAHGVPLPEGVERIVRALAQVAEEGVLLVGANVAYDLTVVEWNLGRLGADPLAEWAPGLVVGDGMVLDRWWDRYRPGRRNLAALCEHHGVRLERAHQAQADAVAAVQVFQRVVGMSRWEPEELGTLASGRWERDRWAELRACEDARAVMEVCGRWAQATEQDRARRYGRPVEGGWPWEKYRAPVGEEEGLEWARQWWRHNARGLERAPGRSGAVMVDATQLGLLLAGAYAAGARSRGGA